MTRQRKGLLFDLMATANFFHLTEDNIKDLLSNYSSKFDKKGDRYKRAIDVFSDILSIKIEDARTPEQFLYDLQSMWIKEDAALIGLNSLLPSRIKGVLCGHDSDREIGDTGVESGPDFEFTSEASSNVTALQFKVTRNLPAWFRIKVCDYKHILLFQENEKQLYYLNKNRILGCKRAFDTRSNWPKDVFFHEEWNQEVYYVPSDVIKDNRVSLNNFVKLLIDAVESK